MRRICASVVLALLVSPASAQEWPAKPVRFIVPFPPGGAADALPRIVGEQLAVRFNQPFVIENRAGATGTIAEKLSAAIIEILKQPEVRKRLAVLSAEPIGSTPAEMARFIRQDAGRWRQAIRAAGVKPGEL